MLRTRRPAARWATALGGAALVAHLVTGTAVAAGQGSIDHVQPDGAEIEILYSVPDAGGSSTVDLSSVSVLVDGEPVPAEAAVAADADQVVRRTTVLAIDASRSMRGDAFDEAKRAAAVFLDTAPADLYVGVVAYAGDVRVVQEPTRDRAATRAAVEGLTLSLGTRLYDGVAEAVRLSGTSGQRSILVLSDGRDTSDTPLETVTDRVAAAEVAVDVVALAQAPAARRPLESLAAAGGGTVLTADDPRALSAAFSDEAESLARQLLVTATLPSGPQAGTDASLEVRVEAAGQSYVDTAFVTVRSATAGSGARVSTPPPPAVPESPFAVSESQMIGGVAGLGVAALIVLLGLFGVLSPSERKKKIGVEDRVAAFSVAGSAWSSAPPPPVRGSSGSAAGNGGQGVSGAAVDIAARALAGNKGAEASIGKRLEGAGMSLKPAEWVLLHAGIAVASGLVGLLLSSGSIVTTSLALVLGAVLPWVYLGFRRGQRVKKFNAQLADTLQLISGSLSAGLSLAQSLSTVEREGNEPVSGEFRRVLVEARLGVSIEDAMESVGERMESRDFKWVVMAIRIQREVGGNLAELLLTVAGTLREREYLRRHVSALSAEGRLSCWVLGGLPPVFMLYLLLTRPDYLMPLFTTSLGLAMCVVMAVLLLGGIFWMSKLVKVDV